MNLDKLTIEILAQVVYKEFMSKNDGVELTKEQWEKHNEQTLELARNIIKLYRQINPMK